MLANDVGNTFDNDLGPNAGDHLPAAIDDQPSGCKGIDPNLLTGFRSLGKLGCFDDLKIVQATKEREQGNRHHTRKHKQPRVEIGLFRGVNNGHNLNPRFTETNVALGAKSSEPYEHSNAARARIVQAFWVVRRSQRPFAASLHDASESHLLARPGCRTV